MLELTAAPQDSALCDLLARLSSLGYRFVTPTPETHRRVVRRKRMAQDLLDVFGWSLPFERDLLPHDIFQLLEHAEMVRTDGRMYRSAIRVASLDGGLFLHSAYPTDSRDSVFFGPDSYRFVRFLERELGNRPAVRQLVDIGAGSGVGAICASRWLPKARLFLCDINPLALRFARVNALHHGLDVETIEGSGIDGIEGPIELAISNPPFIMDSAGRAYRDGGSMHGAALSLDWALATARRLERSGRLLLYTASAIVAGEDSLQAALRAALPADTFRLDYREIDPDIFGEQLDEDGYQDVERIAAVGVVIERS